MEHCDIRTNPLCVEFIIESPREELWRARILSFSCNLLCVEICAVHCGYHGPETLVLVNDSEVLVDFILILDLCSPLDPWDLDGQGHVLIDRQLETFVIVEVVSRRRFQVVRRHDKLLKLINRLHCDARHDQNSDQATTDCLKRRIAFVCQWDVWPEKVHEPDQLLQFVPVALHL